MGCLTIPQPQLVTFMAKLEKERKNRKLIPMAVLSPSFDFPAHTVCHLLLTPRVLRWLYFVFFLEFLIAISRRMGCGGLILPCQNQNSVISRKGFFYWLHPTQSDTRTSCTITLLCLCLICSLHVELPYLLYHQKWNAFFKAQEKVCLILWKLTHLPNSSPLPFLCTQGTLFIQVEWHLGFIHYLLK